MKFLGLITLSLIVNFFINSVNASCIDEKTGNCSADVQGKPDVNEGVFSKINNWLFQKKEENHTCPIPFSSDEMKHYTSIINDWNQRLANGEKSDLEYVNRFRLLLESETDPNKQMYLSQMIMAKRMEFFAKLQDIGNKFVQEKQTEEDVKKLQSMGIKNDKYITDHVLMHGMAKKEGINWDEKNGWNFGNIDFSPNALNKLEKENPTKAVILERILSPANYSLLKQVNRDRPIVVGDQLIFPPVKNKKDEGVVGNAHAVKISKNQDLSEIDNIFKTSNDFISSLGDDSLPKKSILDVEKNINQKKSALLSLGLKNDQAEAILKNEISRVKRVDGAYKEMEKSLAQASEERKKAQRATFIEKTLSRDIPYLVGGTALLYATGGTSGLLMGGAMAGGLTTLGIGVATKMQTSGTDQDFWCAFKDNMQDNFIQNFSTNTLFMGGFAVLPVVAGGLASTKAGIATLGVIGKIGKLPGAGGQFWMGLDPTTAGKIGKQFVDYGMYTWLAESTISDAGKAYINFDMANALKELNPSLALDFEKEAQGNLMGVGMRVGLVVGGKLLSSYLNPKSTGASVSDKELAIRKAYSKLGFKKEPTQAEIKDLVIKTRKEFETAVDKIVKDNPKLNNTQLQAVLDKNSNFIKLKSDMAMLSNLAALHGHTQASVAAAAKAAQQGSSAASSSSAPSSTIKLSTTTTKNPLVVVPKTGNALVTTGNKSLTPIATKADLVPSTTNAAALNAGTTRVGQEVKPSDISKLEKSLKDLDQGNMILQAFPNAQERSLLVQIDRALAKKYPDLIKRTAEMAKLVLNCKR